MRRILVLVGLTGCDLIFPLRGPQAVGRDAPVIVDAFRPLVPPDGTTACGPRPTLETWTYDAHGLAGTTGNILGPKFTGADRVMFTQNGRLFETPLAGPPVEFLDLALSDGSGIRFPGPTPGGEMIWFNRFAQNATPSVGNYYAIRNGDRWTATRADFGITALQLIPSNVGYYAGAARMIVAVEPSAGDGLRLVELETLDGISWTVLNTLPFSDGSSIGGDFSPTIAADGCFVVFRREAKIFISQRESGGTFMDPIEIPALANALDPAINATSDRLWAIQSGVGILDGTP